MTKSRPTRRWFQFSLKTLLVLVTLCALLLGSIAYRRDRQRRAAEVIRALGGRVTIVYRSTLDIVGTAQYVTLNGRFSDQKRVTDDDLAPLRSLRGTKELDLSNNSITGRGLLYLTGATDLEYLLLSHNRITDDGLAHLKGLTRLRVLGLADNRITDAGLAHLQRLTNLEHLDLENNSGITDAGLRHLNGLTRLKIVDLFGTKATKEGVSQLQKALPSSQIVL